ncbi:copper chaperone PCu(A)C [Motiliproteus sediminis]|uniref:copper chaperone PCu(A)C n=1 Tax=Motiliproteus sediminis TaxID=1468178 RepID=UPI001AEFDD18|nr:copper chaperone PCu(A)C [Motiliproteus sediminis]
MKKSMLATLLLALTTITHADVVVHHGYLRASAPGAPNSAGFMVLYNRGDKEVALTSAATEAAQVTELHNHVEDNGVMRMRQVAHVQLPAGAHVELQPGGYHLMLMGLKGQLTEGQRVAVTLGFNDGSTQQLELPVVRGAPTRQHHPDHQHDHGHQPPHGTGHQSDSSAGHHH